MKNNLMTTFKKLIPFFALAVLVLMVLERANPYTTVPTRDGGCYLYIGRLILRGELPYIDAWDSKPPAIFYINALGLFLGKGSRWGVWLLEFVFLSLAACIGYKLLQKLWQPGAAVFGMIFWVWGLDRVFWKGNLVEEYPLLFSMAAICLFALGIQYQNKRLYDFSIGVMTVLCFLFRANNIGAGIAIALCWISLGIIHRQYLLMIKRLGTMLAGGLTSLALIAIFLWQQGILVEAWNASILYNFSYVGDRSSVLSSIIPGFQYLGMVAWISLLGYVTAIYSLVKMMKEKSVQPFILFPIILFPVEILLSSLSGRGYMHYFINWLPAVALLSGFSYKIFAPILFSQKLQSFVSAEKTVMLVAGLFAMILGYGRVVDYVHAFNILLFNRARGIEIISPAASYIRDHTNPEDIVLDWGQSGINYMTRRDAPSAYLWYPQYLPSKVTDGLENGFLQDLKSNPPEIIIDAYLVGPDDMLSLDPEIRQEQISSGKGLLTGKATNIDQVFQFIEDHYVVETVIEGFVIYRLQTP